MRVYIVNYTSGKVRAIDVPRLTQEIAEQVSFYGEIVTDGAQTFKNNNISRRQNGAQENE